MSTEATLVLNPEVTAFVEEVRARLADLPLEEQQELVEGLEADLSDLVAERGAGALGDPAAYARELRQAAGLGDEITVGRGSRAIRASVTAFLDACQQRFDAFAARLPWDVAPVLTWARPLWWITRAWVAVQFVDLALGSTAWSGARLIPSLNGLGGLVLVAAVAISVQLGRGKLWPGGDRGLMARIVLLGLNGFAIVATPMVVAEVESTETEFWKGYENGYEEASGASEMQSGDPALTFDGNPVRNIYPYDAQGRPLTGVQLVDSSGRALTLTNDPYNEGTGWGDFVLVPWLNGKTAQFNVFPLPEQRLDQENQEAVGVPTLQSPPFASVSPVTLEGVQPSVLRPGPARPGTAARSR